MNLVARAHNALLNHLMQKTGCCAARHGRYCRTGDRLSKRYERRYWADYVLRGKDRADRQLRLREVPEQERGEVQRLVVFLFACRTKS